MNVKKKLILIPVVILVVFTILVFYIFKTNIHSKNEDIHITTHLSEQVQEIIRTGMINHDSYETILDLWNPDDFQKFLYLQYDQRNDEKGMIYYRYDSEVNKKLGTDVFISDNNLQGIALANLVPSVVGEFPGGSTATRLDYEIFFIKLPEKVVVRHLFILGGEPAMAVKESQRGSVGALPSSKQIAEDIRLTFSKSFHDLINEFATQ